MNRHCITQVVGDNGKWRDAKIEKAYERPSGIFNLHTALEADQSLTYSGIVLFIDDSYVYQQSNNTIVLHKASSFDRLPKIGATYSFNYLDRLVFSSVTQNTLSVKK